MKSQLNPIINYIMKFLTRLSFIFSFFLYSCDESSEIGIDELLNEQKEKVFSIVKLESFIKTMTKGVCFSVRGF